MKKNLMTIPTSDTDTFDRHSIHGKFTTEGASTFLSIYRLAVFIH